MKFIRSALATALVVVFFVESGLRWAAAAGTQSSAAKP